MMMKRISILMILVQVICVASANAADIYWSSAVDGNFSDAGKWSASVPGPTDRTMFEQSGTYTVTNDNGSTNSQYIFTGSAATVTVEIASGKNWSLTGQSDISGGNNCINHITFTGGGTITNTAFRIATGSSAPYGTLVLDNVVMTNTGGDAFLGQVNGEGTLIITNGSFGSASDISVGRGGWGGSGTGYVYVLDGGTLTCPNLNLGVQANNAVPTPAVGTLTIDGGTVNLPAGTLRVGQGNIDTCHTLGYFNMFAGTLNTLDFTVGNGTYSTGIVTMTGGLIDFGRDVKIGVADNSVGIMNMTGGMVTNMSQFRIAVNASVGVVTMKDASMVFTNGNKTVEIARDGVGSMHVTNSFLHTYKITVAQEAGSTGLYTIVNSTNMNKSAFSIANNTLSTGTVRLTSGELYSTNEWASIGNNGNGTFIQTGGKSYWRQLNVGGPASSTGRCVISGGELHVTNGGVLRVSNHGKGHMTVSAGTHYLRVFEIARESTSWGWMNMEGGTINIEPANEPFYVGIRGTGTLYMTGGTIQSLGSPGWGRIGAISGSTGRIDLVGGTINLDDMQMAHDAGSIGVLNVMGGDFILRGWITIPRAGYAEVNVSAGSLRTAEGMEMCAVADSVGVMTVSGGFVACTGNFSVAKAADTTGDLTISGGDMTVINSPYLAQGASSVATMTLSGGAFTNQAQAVFAEGANSKADVTITGGDICSTNNGWEFNWGVASTSTVTVIGTNANINCKWYAVRQGGDVPNARKHTTRFYMSSGGVSPINVIPADLRLEGNAYNTLTVGMKGYMDTVTTNIVPLFNATVITADSNGVYNVTNASLFDVYKVGTTQWVAKVAAASKAGAGTVQNNGYQWLTSATNAGWIAMSTAGLSGTFTTYVRVDTNGASYTAVNLAAAMTAAGQTAYATNKFGDDWIAVTLPVPLNGTPSIAFDVSEYDSNITADVFSIGYIPNLYGGVFRFR